MDQKKIGGFILKMRKEKNMTQKDLADKLGVTDRAVSKWENGRGLPDLSLIQPLCEILGISVNEFFNAEKIEENQLESIAEKNIITAFEERNAEIKKRRLTMLCAIILILIMTFGGARLGWMLFAGLTGEGYSVSCAVNTQKTRLAAEYITQAEYEKSAKYLSLRGTDRDKAEKEWCENMKALEREINIEYIDVSKIVVDDYFPVGNVVMLVNDIKGIEYIFKMQVTIQNGGVAFGRIYIDNHNQDERRKEVADMIDNALSTWYAG